jgi:hypothetical protein
VFWREKNTSESTDIGNFGSGSQGGTANTHQLAGALAARFGARFVIDVGCASSPNFLTTPGFHKAGITVDSKLRERCEAYPSINWVGLGSKELAQTAGLDDEIKESVVICSEVAERDVEGSSFFDGLARLAALAQAMIITTRVTYGGGLSSNPNTPGRESAWTLSAFREFLTGKGMTPSFLGFTASSAAVKQGKTIVAICDGCAPALGRSPDPDFHPLAIVTTYNDADIAIQTILKMLDDGIDVDVLDNWSTDGTFEQLMVLCGLRKGIRIERFPVSGPTDNHEFEAILRRKEEIAARFPGRWIIHHDSDEIRCSPWAGVSLRGGLQLVDQMKFTAVDFTVCDFRPIDCRFSPGNDPEQQIRHFQFGDRPDLFTQVKAWRQGDDRVDLASHAGHQVCFPERKIFAYNFILKHYPMRTPAQARRKVFAERRERYSPRLRAKGWHIQYDSMKMDDQFLWNPDDLIEFDDRKTRSDYLTELIAGIGIASPG